VRVEAPGKAVEFNPNLELVTRQSAEGIREKKNHETNDRAFPRVDSNQLETAVEISNRAMEISRYGLQFRIHEDSGRVQVKVVDSETKEILREIPPEHMLKIAASIKEMLDNLHEMVGVLVNEIV
jgi:flagellar protein FlaG